MDNDPTRPPTDNASPDMGCMTIPVAIIGWLLHLAMRKRVS